MSKQPGKILTEVFATELPQFERKDELKPGYWFVHGPDDDFFSALIVQASRKYQCFEVDVYSGVFPVWDRQFGRHQLRASTGLPNLRENSGLVDMRKVAYNHDGTELGIRESLKIIVSEIEKYALPWFEERKKSRNFDALMDFGLRWITDRSSDISKDIDCELQNAYRVAGNVPWKVEHPILKTLLYDLRAYASKKRVPKEVRQDINVFALDLLRFAGQKKKKSQQDSRGNG